MNGGLSMVEMKSGYKMTEVGVIPEDWEVKNVSESCLIKARIGWQGLKKSEYMSSGDYLLITGTDFDNGQVNWKSCAYVSKARYEQDSNIKIRPQDILISKDGTIGKVAYLGMIPKAGTLNSGIFVIRANDRKIDQVFLSKIFMSFYFEDFLNRLVAGSTINHLYQKDFVKFCFPLPNSEEQAAIAAALSDVDSLISALTKKIEKKKAIKQGLMQQLLTGKKRLPGYEKNREPVQTEWGAIPKDWKTLSIGKCCSIKARIGWQGLKKSEYLSSGEYVLVTGTDFLNGRIDWKSCVYVSKKRYEQDANIQIVKHDILITKDGTIGKVAFLDDVPCLGTLNSGIFVVRSHSEELDQCYLSKIFESFIFDAFLESLVAGSTINHLYQKDFVHFNFPVPPTISEQTAIANILSDCDSEIAALEEKRDKYKEIKQGMMQQLLTGKIRLIK